MGTGVQNMVEQEFSDENPTALLFSALYFLLMKPRRLIAVDVIAKSTTSKITIRIKVMEES